MPRRAERRWIRAAQHDELASPIALSSVQRPQAGASAWLDGGESRGLSNGRRQRGGSDLEDPGHLSQALALPEQRACPPHVYRHSRPANPDALRPGTLEPSDYTIADQIPARTRRSRPTCGTGVSRKASCCRSPDRAPPGRRRAPGAPDPSPRDDERFSRAGRASSRPPRRPSALGPRPSSRPARDAAPSRRYVLGR